MRRTCRPAGSTTSKTLIDLEQEGYRRLELKEAEKLWRFWYEWTDSKCIHGEALPASCGSGGSTLHSGSSACCPQTARQPLPKVMSHRCLLASRQTATLPRPSASTAPPGPARPAGDRCSERLRGGTCRAGMRKDDLHLICGAVLPIWWAAAWLWT